MGSKKTCRKCLAALPHSEFWKEPSNLDGLNSWCKSCNSAYAHSRRHIVRKFPRIKNPERDRLKSKRQRLNHPEQCRARWLVFDAIKKGLLKKRPCEACGDKKSQAHHHDYSKPLDVVWLCAVHHAQVHPRRIVKNLRQFGFSEQSK